MQRMLKFGNRSDKQTQAVPLSKEFIAYKDKFRETREYFEKLEKVCNNVVSTSNAHISAINELNDLLCEGSLQYPVILWGGILKLFSEFFF